MLFDPVKSAATVLMFVVAADAAILAILLWIEATAVTSELMPLTVFTELIFEPTVLTFAIAFATTSISLVVSFRSFATVSTSLIASFKS